MAIDARLLEILACPEDKGPLLYFAADELLYNPRLKRKYRVEHDVPQMLIEDAAQASEAEHQALLEKAKAQGIQPNF
ncbi:MAG: Trm112 family protein [Myxococcota bacterium]